jgi:membrane-associated phospholipid phosphatase
VTAPPASAGLARLRPAEIWAMAYFAYAALLAALLAMPAGIRGRCLSLGLGLSAAVLLLAVLENRLAPRPPDRPHLWTILRDWLPLGLALVAYRQMDWFTPAAHDHHLEQSWVVWDRALLGPWGLRAAIESLGLVLPAYLELCYLVVYAIGPFALAVLYILRRRDRAPLVVFTYLAGTLAAYALFPYFPSEPPRSVYPGQDLPAVTTALRRLNLGIVGGYGIHSSVFPSAHVSSAFSAAFGMLLALPRRRGLWIGMLVYAASVAVATVYGRYHYAVDAVAGAALGLGAWLAGWCLKRHRR